MKRFYHIKMQQVSLKEATELMRDSSVFYSFGTAMWELNNNTLAHSIRNNGIYLTPVSFLVETDDITQIKF